MCQILFRDLAFLVVPICAHRGFTGLPGELLVVVEEFAHLHDVVGEGFRRGIDRGQAAADHYHRQPQLHVGERIVLGRAGELQRHEEVGRRAHAARESIRDVEYRRLARTDAKGYVVEAHRHRVLERHRAAEAHTAEHRELAAALEQQADELEKILVPAHGDAVFRNAAEPCHDSRAERFVQAA